MMRENQMSRHRLDSMNYSEQFGIDINLIRSIAKFSDKTNGIYLDKSQSSFDNKVDGERRNCRERFDFGCRRTCR